MRSAKPLLRLFPLLVSMVAAGLPGQNPESPALASEEPAEEAATSSALTSPVVVREVPNGRIEHVVGGRNPIGQSHRTVKTFPGVLQVVRLWGTPQQRGEAMAQLMGESVVRMIRTEYRDRVGSNDRNRLLIELVLRGQIRRLIDYPDDQLLLLQALWRGIEQREINLSMPFLERDMDFDDLYLINALDILGFAACSGFTVWGEETTGGGVLTGRNFDWGLKSNHLVDDTILLVEHPADGSHATALVTWPGYFGAVTGINAPGTAVFLHVGGGPYQIPPPPDCFPTAAAARRILQLPLAEDSTPWAAYRDLLEQTGPPATYITRVVLAAERGDGPPARWFEATAKELTLTVPGARCVVTNHFQHKGAVAPRWSSAQRHKTISKEMRGMLVGGDQAVDAAEGWRLLDAVGRQSLRQATLHSVVYRARPFLFELGIGVRGEDDVVISATRSPRMFRFAREQVFPAEGPWSEADQER